MSGDRECILIVDDSKLQRAFFRQMLEPRFHVIEAEDGESCLRIMEDGAETVHAVLLDLVMPGMDGFEVLRRRRGSDALSDIPVIVLTSGDPRTMQIRAFELGANDFLNKPGEKAIVLSRLQNVLESGRRIRALVEQRNRMQIRAELDGMTGLLNKVTCEQLIGEALRQPEGERSALFVIDIDNFKAVNDIHGHEMGDHTIRVVANILSSCFRKTDIVGRVGGDEFCILMKGISSKAEVRRRAEKLLEMVRRHENQTIPDNISISVGIACSDGASGFEELFSRADSALYLSKKAGRDCFREFGGEGFREERTEKKTAVLLLSGSRSVSSMLEYSFSSYAKLERAADIPALEEMIRRFSGDIACIIVDVSEEENDGVLSWSGIVGKAWAKQYPLIAVCREGAVSQLRTALDTGLLRDLYLAPLDAQFVERRIQAFRRESNA